MQGARHQQQANRKAGPSNASDDANEKAEMEFNYNFGFQGKSLHKSIYANTHVSNDDMQQEDHQRSASPLTQRKHVETEKGSNARPM